MSPSTTQSELNRLPEKIQAGIDRAKPASDDESESQPTGTAKELLDVIEASNALLRTIDLDKLADVVDVEELPSLVDLEYLSEAIVERDPDLILDLSDLERIVDRRELWNSVDLLEFAGAKRRLDGELEDVLGEDSSVGSDSEAVADAKEFVTSLRPDAKQALIQQEATEKIKGPRAAVVDRHAGLERLYESNGRRFSNAGVRGIARNPTAVSLHPSGPLPDSVSTRVSTVPAAVAHTKIDALPRIYGRRWRTVDAGRGR